MVTCCRPAPMPASVNTSAATVTAVKTNLTAPPPEQTTHQFWTLLSETLREWTAEIATPYAPRGAGLAMTEMLSLRGPPHSVIARPAPFCHCEARPTLSLRGPPHSVIARPAPLCHCEARRAEAISLLPAFFFG